MTINLSATEKDPVKLSLSMGTANKYSGSYLKEVGLKYSIGMGEFSPGADVMSNAVYTGTDDRYRQMLSTQESIKNDNIRRSLILEIAQTNDREVTQDDLDLVRGLSDEQLYAQNLPTILEEAYAKRAIETAATIVDEDTQLLSEAMQDNPEQALELLDRAQYSAARQFILSNKIQSILSKSEFKGPQDVVAHTWAWAQQLVPFWQDWSVSTAVEGAPAQSLFVGENLDRAISYLWTLPPAQFKEELDKVEAGFMGRGDFLGLQRFLNSVYQYSESDKVIDNLWQGFDVVTLPVAKFAKSLGGSIKAAARGPANLAEASVRIGKNAEAAKVITDDALAKGVLPSNNIKHISEIENVLPSNARPHQTWTGTPKMPPAALQRYEAAMLEQDDLIAKALREPVRVDRVDANQLAEAKSRAARDMEEMFGHARYSIVDTIYKEADNADNFSTITVRFGLKNGDYFKSEKQAQNNAKWVGLRTDSYRIIPMDGGKWSVEVTRPIREDNLRTVDIETTHKTPDRWSNRFLDFIRTPDDKVSPAQVTERSAVVYGSEHLSNIMQALAKPLVTLKKKELSELDEVFRYNRIPQKATGKGFLFHNVNDFEDYFYQKFNKLPSEAQTEAYSAYVKLNDLDWAIRNQDIFVQKIRMGMEDITFRLDGLDFPVPIEGRVIDRLPPTSAQSRSHYRFGIVQNGKMVDTTYSRFMSQKMIDKTNELVADGYKVIQLSTHLKVGDKTYQYIVIRDFKRNPLNVNQLSYNPGHKIDENGHYLKQSNIRNEDDVVQYYGDRGLANVPDEATGVELANRFNIAREKIRNKSPDAETYVRDNLPITWEQVQKNIQDGFFDLNNPVHYVRSGQSTRSLLNGEWDDLSGYEHNPASRITGRFIGQKSEFNLPTYTVEQNVANRFTGETKLSPLEALQVGLNNAVQVRIMNDYRIKSGEDFVREFGNLLDISSEELRTGSLEFLYDPRYFRDADPIKVQKAESVRKTILGLLNHKTYVEKAVDLHKERLISSVKKVAGQRVADFAQDSLLPTIQNGDQWLRAAAFHTKLGMFNPKQLFLQASAAVNVISIAGTHGVKAAGNITQAMLALRYTNRADRIAAISKKAVGMKPAHFAEAIEAFKRSGYSRVGRDTAYLDMLAGPSLKSSATKSVLDLAATPFNGGELIARTMGWMAAYDEWRAVNKFGELNRQAEKTILARAQLLTGNMSRQSNARWQKGYLSIVTQFFGAQARLTEQMLSGGLFGSGRLTRAEKARLFVGMSSLYGLPVGVGASIGVLPVRDMLRDWLAENEIEYDQTLAEPFIDGFASSFMEFITGGDFNISEKYGLGGVPTMWDLFKQDATLTDLMLGASGGIIGDTIADTAPMWKVLGSIVDFDDTTFYPITMNELIDPFRNITTVNAFVRSWEAANLQKWMSRNGTVLSDATESEALISAILGIDAERVSDAYNQADAVAKWNEHDRNKRREISVDLTRAVQAYRTGNEDVGDMLIKRARRDGVLLGLNGVEFSRLLQDAIAEEGFDDVIAEAFEKKALEREKRLKQ